MDVVEAAILVEVDLEAAVVDLEAVVVDPCTAGLHEAGPV